MNIDSIILAYFSPTQTTKQTVKAIAEGTAITDVKEIDFTPSNVDLSQIEYKKNQLLILGVPVYGGRVPKIAEDRLKKLAGKGNPAVSVVLYGNRLYEDALLELKNISEEQGLKAVAGGAFIGQHTYSADNTPIAVGRPDSDDLTKAKVFGKKIIEKLSAVDQLDTLGELTVPGDFPYKERKVMPPMPPITNEETCVKCGQCAEACPVDVVTVEETVHTEAEACIRCCACVPVCPTDSRVMNHPKILEIAEWLHNNFSEPKSPETYL